MLSPRKRRLAVASILLSMLIGTACSKGTPSGPSETMASTAASAQPQTVEVPADAGPVPSFNGARAMQYVLDIVAFGPRPIGSPNHKKVEQYILSHLKSDVVELDDFTVSPPQGKFAVRNIIAKFPGSRDGIVLIVSHYDTNWPLRNTPYVGANDGASSSALLLEMANQLRVKDRAGYSVWLVWDDAEESMQLPWVDPESLYGVRHLVEKWQEDGTLKRIKALLLEDMIGDADLNVDRDDNSTPWLEDLVQQAATRLGYQSHFFGRTIGVTDDHIPFIEHGVPSADLIDFSYGYNNVFWHTTDDTADKLSPKSLEIVGQVTLEAVEMLGRMQEPVK
jgi:glutaminyl-peptide cyclotransferase